jgi:hypothetical protein
MSHNYLFDFYVLSLISALCMCSGIHQYFSKLLRTNILSKHVCLALCRAMKRSLDSSTREEPI